MVKFLLLQEAIPSKSQVKVNIAHDEDGIKQPSSTPIFFHSQLVRYLSQGMGVAIISFQSKMKAEHQVKMEVDGFGTSIQLEKNPNHAGSKPWLGPCLCMCASATQQANGQAHGLGHGCPGTCRIRSRSYGLHFAQSTGSFARSNVSMRSWIRSNDNGAFRLHLRLDLT